MKNTYAQEVYFFVMHRKLRCKTDGHLKFVTSESHIEVTFIIQDFATLPTMTLSYSKWTRHFHIMYIYDLSFCHFDVIMENDTSVI